MINTDNFRPTCDLESLKSDYYSFVCNKSSGIHHNGNCISNYFAKERIPTSDTFFKQLDLYRRRTSVCVTAKDRRLIALLLKDLLHYY